MVHPDVNRLADLIDTHHKAKKEDRRDTQNYTQSLGIDPSLALIGDAQDLEMTRPTQAGGHLRAGMGPSGYRRR
jgi:hypothetical protein